MSILADGDAQKISIADAEVTRLTNNERANVGFPALVPNADLMRLARSTGMAARGYYDHFDPVTWARLPPSDAAENLDRAVAARDCCRLDGQYATPSKLLTAAYGRTGVGIAIDAPRVAWYT